MRLDLGILTLIVVLAFRGYSRPHSVAKCVLIIILLIITGIPGVSMSWKAGGKCYFFKYYKVACYIMLSLHMIST